ncbi:hypothetical protein K2P56_02000 [Patescibacteria group bacterium]|nr:hypothetical protein [Patescibacteria group bacterium]
MDLRYTMLGIVIALIVGGGVFLYFFLPLLSSDSGGEGQTPSTIVDPFGTSGTSGGGGTKPVAVVENEAMKKFSGEVRKVASVDTSVAPGYYELTQNGDVGSSTPYSMYYLDTDKSLTVTLFEQPIGKTRRMAEDDLLARFKISKEEACDLIYSVTVPMSVDADYFGQNLGFSFCTGSVVLREI